MHRFYLPPQACEGSVLTLTDREAHHAAQVLRIKPGERVIVLDGAGQELLCEVRDISRKAVGLNVQERKRIPPSAGAVTLLQAIPKGKIIESIIQKAVELGVYRIVPLLSERVVTDLDEEDARSKAEKWNLVAIEAIKQCGSAWLPKVEAPVTPKAFLAREEPFEMSFIGSLQKDARHPRLYFQAFEKEHQRLPASVAMWIGPEGDFTPEELSSAQLAGVLPITLGRLVLRCETAAVYCLSVINYELQAPRELKAKA
jgi:16S rRNA (uracil1498-N3)-methyltransferase